MRHDEYLAHDATALAAAVASGDVSARELLELALAQLARVQPKVNAVNRLMEAQARAQLERPLAGALAGVPLPIKDGIQDYAGVPTGYGSRAMQRVVPKQHSAIVRRLLGAGAVIFGKTNLPEFGLKGVTDPIASARTNNPWDLGRTPGGSSGGAAAAVAAGVVPMAAGNDGGGSLRIPAACCGLFALKPSRGRVSVGPGMGEAWFGANVDGVISRSVRDTALALDVLAGPEPGDPYVIAPPPAPYAELARREPPRLRIAFSTASPIGTPVHAEAVAAVRATAALLQRLGHEVDEAAPVIDGAALASDYLHVYFGAVPAVLRWARTQGARDDEFEPLTRVLGALGEGVSAGTLTTHLMQWNAHARALGAFHQRFDLWLTPTLAGPPIPHGTGDPPPAQVAALMALVRTGLLKRLAGSALLRQAIDRIARENLTHVPFTQIANLTGVPAMSVPLHWTADGLPLGVQFVAAFGGEATLLQLATQLEAAQPWFDRLPPIAREAP
ncbi:MAG: amidase [Burkholderiaceae bacterium]|nr:amidase [Burkholderiaceae bacterium]